jgi:serine protease AprX
MLGKASISLFALLATAVGVTAPANAAPPTTRIDPYLASRLRTIGPLASVRVVINADTLEHALAAAKAAGVRPGVRMNRLGVVVGTGTPAAVRRLVGKPGVAWIGDADQPMHLDLDTSHQATRADQATTVFSKPGGGPYDGAGVGVMVIDGGIDAGHPMFVRNGQSKVRRNLETIPFGDIVSPLPVGEGADGYGLLIDMPIDTTDDVAGHGTHVASIAAGYPVTSPLGHELVGAAPGATLYGISVATAGSTYYGALAAQYWTLLNHAAPCGAAAAGCPPIRVVNNSYGPRGGGPYDPASPTVEAVRQAIAEGVTWVWAAGNDGGDGSADVTNPTAKEPTPGLIAVASYDDGQTGDRNNALSSFSSRGLATDPSTWPDVAAPGQDIEAACRPTHIDCGLDLLFDTDADYGRMSGTSMAAPHVAGYVAVLLQADPTLTPAGIENLLEDTAHKFTAGAAYAADPTNPDDTSSFDKGHGLVDVTAALATTLSQPNPAPINNCLPNPAIADPAGDATDAGLGGIVPAQLPGNSDPNVDIVGASAQAGGAIVRFGVNVIDLGDQPSAGSVGDHVRFGFIVDGVSYELRLTRDTNPLGAPTEQFDLYESTVDANGLPTSVNVAPGLNGHFDPATNEAWAEVPSSALPGLGGSVGNVTVLWQRLMGVLTLTADTAHARCGLTI